MNSDFVDCFDFFNQNFEHFNLISLVYYQGFKFKKYNSNYKNKDISILNFLSRRIKFMYLDRDLELFDFSKFINLVYLCYICYGCLDNYSLILPKKCVYLICNSSHIKNIIYTLPEKIIYLKCIQTSIDNIDLLKNLRYLECINCTSTHTICLNNFKNLKILDIHRSTIKNLFFKNCNIFSIILLDNKYLSCVSLNCVDCKNFLFFKSCVENLEFIENSNIEWLCCAFLPNLSKIKLPVLQKLNIKSMEKLKEINTELIINKSLTVVGDEELLKLIDPEKIKT